MVLLCRSCVVGVEVSSAPAGTQVKCPYCGALIGEGSSEPAAAEAQGAPSRRRAAVVVSAFVACLALPVALCLLLLGVGEPEKASFADTRVVWNQQQPARAVHAPGRDSSRSGRGLIDAEKAPAGVDSLPFPVTILPGPTQKPDAPPAGQPAELMPQAPPPVLTKPGQGPLGDKAGSGSRNGSSLQDKGANLLDPKAPKNPAPAAPIPPFVAQPPVKGPVQQAGFVGQRAGQRVTFLGSVAEGGRFCIIADRSASMRGNALETVKVELVRTLRSLGPDSQFFVTFFNTQAFPQPGQRWLPGGAGVQAVLPWIGSMSAEGNTDPTPAFELALKWLAPQPDAIFFMTDGIFETRVAAQVALLNQRVPRIPIHTILFIHESQSRGRALVGPAPLPRAGSPRLPPGPRVAANAQRVALQNQASRAQELQEIQAAAALLQRIALDSGGTFRAVMAPPNPPGR